jgi:hypothetical protein
LAQIINKLLKKLSLPFKDGREIAHSSNLLLFFWQIVCASSHINDCDHPPPKVFHWNKELDHHSRGNER